MKTSLKIIWAIMSNLPEIIKFLFWLKNWNKKKIKDKSREIKDKIILARYS